MNVRATNTLENIEEDALDEKDPGRNRRGSNPAFDKRREAGTSDGCSCHVLIMTTTILYGGAH